MTSNNTRDMENNFPKRFSHCREIQAYLIELWKEIEMRDMYKVVGNIILGAVVLLAPFIGIIIGVHL